MMHFAEIAYTGLVAVALQPLRSIVVVLCLLAVLVPYLVGISLSKGIQQDAEASVQYGADLYVSGNQFGRPVPVPESSIDAIRAITGVERVTPRIIGSVTLGKDREKAVVVGLPLDHLPRKALSVEGRLFRKSIVPELVVGSDLARRLRLKLGDRIPPFYRSSQGEQVSQVVGIFRSDVSLWQSHIIFTSLEVAQRIFDQPGRVTDVLVECRAGAQMAVRDRILLSVAIPTDEPNASIRPHVVSREDLAALLPRGLLHREGVFNLHFSLAFVSAILVVVVSSGVGLRDRRREIALLKASGWQTDEVLLRAFTESFLLTHIGAVLAVLLAYVWLDFLNGYWIASVFLSGVDAYPTFEIPFRMTPLPVLLSFMLSFVVVMSGTVYSSWRAAVAPPWTALR